VARLINQGTLRGRQGDADVRRGVTLVEELQEPGHQYRKARALSNLGHWYVERGEADTAEQFFTAALSLSREIQNSLPGMVLSNRIGAHLTAGRLEDAWDLIPTDTERDSHTPRDCFAIDSLACVALLEKGRLGHAKDVLRKWAHIAEDAPLSFFPHSAIAARARIASISSRRSSAKELVAKGRRRAAELEMERAELKLENLERRLGL